MAKSKEKLFIEAMKKKFERTRPRFTHYYIWWLEAVKRKREG